MGNFTEVMESRRRTEALGHTDWRIVCWAEKASTNVPVLGDTIDGFISSAAAALDVTGFSRPEVEHVDLITRKTVNKQWAVVIMRGYRDFT